MARRTRAVAYAAAGRHELAIADLRQLEQDGQLTPEDAVVLGRQPAVRRATDGGRGGPRARRAREPEVPAAAAVARRGAHPGAEATRKPAASCERVLKLVPDHIEALRRLGDLALLRGDLAGGGHPLRRILELDAGDVPAMTKLGVVPHAERDAAMRRCASFEQAIERDPKNAEALLYLAGALASRRASRRRVAVLRARARTRVRRSTMALNGLGLTRLAVGDRAGAAAAFRESLRLDPKQPEVARSLAELKENARN